MYWVDAVWSDVYPTCVSSKLSEFIFFQNSIFDLQLQSILPPSIHLTLNHRIGRQVCIRATIQHKYFKISFETPNNQNQQKNTLQIYA